MNSQLLEHFVQLTCLFLYSLVHTLMENAVVDVCLMDYKFRTCPVEEIARIRGIYTELFKQIIQDSGEFAFMPQLHNWFVEQAEQDPPLDDPEKGPTTKNYPEHIKNIRRDWRSHARRTLL